MDEYDLDLEDFDDKMAAEEDELNDDQDEDMTSELRTTEDSEGEGQLPDMNTKEMKAKGFYKVEATLRSKWMCKACGSAWLEILGQVGVLLHGRGNVGALHSIYLGAREREFNISRLLQC